MVSLFNLQLRFHEHESVSVSVSVMSCCWRRLDAEEFHFLSFQSVTLHEKNAAPSFLPVRPLRWHGEGANIWTQLLLQHKSISHSDPRERWCVTIVCQVLRRILYAECSVLLSAQPSNSLMDHSRWPSWIRFHWLTIPEATRPNNDSMVRFNVLSLVGTSSPSQPRLPFSFSPGDVKYPTLAGKLT